MSREIPLEQRIYEEDAEEQGVAPATLPPLDQRIYEEDTDNIASASPSTGNGLMQVLMGMNERVGQLYSPFARAGHEVSGQIQDLMGDDFAANRLKSIARSGNSADQYRNTVFDELSPPAPATKGEAVGRAAGAGIPDAALLSMATLPAAITRAASTTLPRTVVGGLWDDMAKSIAANPGTTATYDVLGGMGSGASTQIAQNADWGVGGQLLAGVGGGIAPIVAFNGLRSGVGALGDVGNAVMHPRQTYEKVMQGVTDRATRKGYKMIASELTPEVLDEWKRVQELKNTIPGFDPTLSAVSPTLRNTEEGLANDLVGSQLNDNIRRKLESIEAIAKYADDTFEPVPNAAAHVRDTARNSMMTQEESVLRDADALVTGKRELGSQLKETFPSQVGQKLRSRFNALEEEASAAAGKEAEELGLNSMTMTGYKKLQDRLASIKDNITLHTAKKSIPSYLDETLEKFSTTDFSTSGRPYTFKDARDLFEKSGRLYRQELNAPTPDLTKVDIYKQMRDSAADFLEKDLPTDMDPNLGQKYGAWRKNYVDNYVSRFGSNGVEDIRRGVPGNYAVNDEQIPKKFWKKGDETAARQFSQTFRDDPIAMESMNDFVLDDVRRSVIKDGAIDPKKLESYLDNHKSVLVHFPNIQKQLGDVKTASDTLVENGAKIAQQQREFNRSYLQGVTGKNPEAVVRGAVVAPNEMEALVKATKDNPEALRRAVWEEMLNNTSGNKDIPVAQNMRKYMQKYGESLSKVYDTKHIKAINDIIDAFGYSSNVPIPKGGQLNLSPMKGLEDALGMQYPALMSRIYAMESGRSSPKLIGWEIGRRMQYAANKRGATNSILKVMDDPQRAIDLANYVKSKGTNKIAARRLNTWLLGNGMKTIEEEYGTDEGDEQ